MNEALHLPAADMRFEPFGDEAGSASIARLIGPDLSRTMGAGIAAFDGCSIRRELILIWPE